MRAVLLALLILTPPLAQRTVEPVRVSISTETRADIGGDFDGLIRAEFRRLRNMIITERRPDFEIYITATPLTEDGKFFGYAAALLVITRSKSSEKYHLSIHTGRGLDALARHLVETLRRDYFEKHRGGGGGK